MPVINILCGYPKLYLLSGGAQLDNACSAVTTLAKVTLKNVWLCGFVCTPATEQQYVATNFCRSRPILFLISALHLNLSRHWNKVTANKLLVKSTI